jgi:hypothetical protein
MDRKVAPKVVKSMRLTRDSAPPGGRGFEGRSAATGNIKTN